MTDSMWDSATDWYKFDYLSFFIIVPFVPYSHKALGLFSSVKFALSNSFLSASSTLVPNFPLHTWFSNTSPNAFSHSETYYQYETSPKGTLAFGNVVARQIWLTNFFGPICNAVTSVSWLIPCFLAALNKSWWFVVHRPLPISHRSYSQSGDDQFLGYYRARYATADRLQNFACLSLGLEYDRHPLGRSRSLSVYTHLLPEGKFSSDRRAPTWSVIRFTWVWLFTLRWK